MNPTLAITFVHTAILGAAAAAVLPVIIHLLLRSKPRLVVFPAMRFVRQTHMANVSMNRIKHLILLMMRMAAIALIAFVLARPMIRTEGSIHLGAKEPVSAVVIMDASGSMSYRVARENRRTRLDVGKDNAIRLLEKLPDGSQSAVLWPGRPTADLKVAPGVKTSVDLIQELSDSPEAQDKGLASYRRGQRANMVQMVDQAYTILKDAPNKKHEIYIVSDRAQDSWSGLSPGTWASRDDVNVFLLDVAASDNQDFLISSARWEAEVISPKRRGRLTVEVRSNDLAADLRTLFLQMQQVHAEPGGPARGADAGEAATETGKLRAEVKLPGKATTAAATFELPLLAPGLYAGKVWIDDEDEIDEDNVYYLALEVGNLPLVMVIEKDVAQEYSTPRLVRAALAPPHLEVHGEAKFDLVRIPATDFVVKRPQDRKLLEGAQAVILADVDALVEGQWTALKDYVGGGGTLVTLLGPTTNAQSLVTTESLGVLPIRGLVGRIQSPEGVQPALPDFTHNAVMRTYLQNDLKPMLDREKVYQYWAIQDADKKQPGVDTLLHLAGANPAPLLLERQFGATGGHSLLLTTSPQPAWSEWIQMGSNTWTTLLYSMVMGYNRGTQQAYQFVMDAKTSETVLTAPPSFRVGDAVEIPPDGRKRGSLTVGATTGKAALHTQYTGVWEVDFQGANGATRPVIYAVNADPHEYDLVKIDADQIAAGFPRDRFILVQDPSDLERGQARARSSQEEIGALVGLALLLLLIGESFFSNRFYRRPAASALDRPGGLPGPGAETDAA
ncbi:MAG: hypothetical protein BIFFINMI_02884 [Phycisphaerae bacterium]|nr:hypothetical protein [Phycisphaerae bacterium]